MHEWTLLFKESDVVYKCKFNTFYKKYKNDKVANGTLGNDHYDYKFYESTEIQWYFNNNIMKHVLANANDSTIPMKNLDIITTFIEFSKEECNSNDIEISNKISKGEIILLHIQFMTKNSVF